MPRNAGMHAPRPPSVRRVKCPIEATKDHPKRVDYEYKRAGVANIFMFAEPLAQWRHVSVRDRKTKVDRAIEMANLLEGRYSNCEKVIVVCDNLNTHTKGAFYETFEPARARSLVSRIEFHYTPKHGSWLNIAENELSSMTRQCVAGRRIGSTKELQRETTAWHEDVNQSQRGGKRLGLRPARATFVQQRALCPRSESSRTVSAGSETRAQRGSCCP